MDEIMSVPGLGAETGVPVHEALNDARISTADRAARPRYLVRRLSGLEIGVIGDASPRRTTSTSPSTRAATHRSRLSMGREFIGYPAEVGAFTSGGTVSNATAWPRPRARAPACASPGSAPPGSGHCSEDAHHRSRARSRSRHRVAEPPRARSTTPGGSIRGAAA
jgi:hypothetical protein